MLGCACQGKGTQGQGSHKGKQLQLGSPETCIMAPMLATFSVALGSQPAMKIVNSSAGNVGMAGWEGQWSVRKEWLGNTVAQVESKLGCVLQWPDRAVQLDKPHYCSTGSQATAYKRALQNLLFRQHSHAHHSRQTIRVDGTASL